MITKIINSDSFREFPVSVIKRLDFQKEAEEDFLKDIKPEPGRTKLHVIAMGASEVYGQNLNGDSFPEEALKRKVKTFETHGHVFKHHINHDPKIASGRVERAFYNPKMHRVELVLDVDNQKCKDELKRIEDGEPVSVSMSCRVPADFCVAPDTIIECERNVLKRAKEITCFDKVLTHTGEYKKVTQIFVRKTKENMTRIKSNRTNEVLHCTGKHRLLGFQVSKKVNWKYQQQDTDFIKLDWYAAESFKKGDYLAYPIDDRVKETTFLNNKYLARLVGYYLAEGSLIEQKQGASRDLGKIFSGIRLSFHINEIQAHKDVESCCNHLNISFSKYKSLKKQSCDYTLSSKWFASMVYEHCGRYSHYKYLSEDLLFANPELQLELLGAYLNGDGSQDITKRITVTSVSKRLIYDVSKILLRSRILHTVHQNIVRKGYLKGSRTKESRRFVYRLEIPARNINALSKYSFFASAEIKTYAFSMLFYKNYVLSTVLERKNRIAKEALRVYNFAVDEDESYVADGIIVHNCSICGHASRSVQEYCPHLKNEMGKVLSNGKQVGAINKDPDFFDISFVWKPADKTAYVLRKVANKDYVLSGAQLAALEGLGDITYLAKEAINKKSLLRKLSDIEKEIEGLVAKKVPETSREQFILQEAPKAFSGKDFPDETLTTLRELPLALSLDGLSQRGMVLNLPEFMQLLLGEKTGLPTACPGLFGHLEELDETGDGMFDSDEFPSKLTKFLDPFVMDKSLKEVPVNSRILDVTLRQIPRRSLILGPGSVGTKTESGGSRLIIKKSYIEPVYRFYGFYKLASLARQQNPRILLLAVLQNYI